QVPPCMPRWTPAEQHSDHAEIADGVEPERHGKTEVGKNHAAERRADGTADIDADAVGSDGTLQVLPGNELRHDGLPRRGLHRADDPLRNVNSSRLPGVAMSSEMTSANAPEITAIASSVPTRNFRMSTRSATAPAGTARRNIGSVAATCTSDTVSGSG